MDKVLTFSQYRSPNTDQTPVWAASRAQCGLPASFGSSRGLGAPTGVCQVIPAALAHPTGTHASHLRGQPSSWSWDLSLAGTKSRYQVGPLPVPGFLPPLILPKTTAHPTLLVLCWFNPVTELQDWTGCLSQPTHLADGETEAPGGVAAVEQTQGPSLSPEDGGHMLKIMQRQRGGGWGELGLNKTTSPVRSPLLQRSAPGPWQCLLRTPEGGLSDHSRTDGHSLGCPGSTGWAEKLVWVFL